MEEEENDVTNVLIDYYTKNEIDYTSDYKTGYEFLVSSKYKLDSPNFFNCYRITAGNEIEKNELFDLIDGREYTDHLKR